MLRRCRCVAFTGTLMFGTSRMSLCRSGGCRAPQRRPQRPRRGRGCPLATASVRPLQYETDISLQMVLFANRLRRACSYPLYWCAGACVGKRFAWEEALIALLRIYQR